MTHAVDHWPQTRPHPDPIRIAAISASIVLNAAVIALLMRPLEFNPATTQEQPRPVTIIVPDPPPLIAPIDKVKPTPHPVRNTVTHVMPNPPTRPVVSDQTTPVRTPPSQPPSRVDTGGDQTVVPPGPTDIGLSPIATPAPTYPLIALREGITGTVELELLVGVDGRVLEVHVTHSSGNRQLDNAAREQVLRNWRFRPAIRDGIPIQARGRLPIVFTLNGR